MSQLEKSPCCTYTDFREVSVLEWCLLSLIRHFGRDQMSHLAEFVSLQRSKCIYLPQQVPLLVQFVVWKFRTRISKRFAVSEKCGWSVWAVVMSSWERFKRYARFPLKYFDVAGEKFCHPKILLVVFWRHQQKVQQKLEIFSDWRGWIRFSSGKWS